ncbi:hypothetical protein T484DRAFT_1904448, partial [Baffinella frigidus]
RAEGESAEGRLFGIGAVFKLGNDGFFYVRKVVQGGPNTWFFYVRKVVQAPTHGFFYVRKVVQGGPAHTAGVAVGARVIAVDGQRLYHKTAAFLFKLVLGIRFDGAGVAVGARVIAVDGQRLYHKTAAFLFKLVLESVHPHLQQLLLLHHLYYSRCRS